MQVKSKSLFFITILVLIASIFLSQYQVIEVIPKDDKRSSFELSSVNATSPIEYFNETSFPRYTLVGKPLSLIQSPNKGFPVIIETDEILLIEAQAVSETTNWQFKLVSTANNISLDILAPTFDISDNLWHFSTAPEEYIPGLYDLQLNCSAGDDYQTHTVKIVNQKTYPFKILHISDAHFPSYDGKNTTDINLDYIEHINALDADFAIFTGDLIDGYSARDFVNPDTGDPLAAEVQIKLSLWAFDMIELPIYYVGGNHDLDSSTSLPDNPSDVWTKYFGKNYMFFNYIDWSFIGYTCSSSGLTKKGLNSVSSVFSTEKNKPNVLFYHADFMNQASNYRASYNIEVMLYGHEHHEEKYVSDSTLYHCEAPMFNNESSVITVLNETSVSLDDVVYDFSSLLEIPTTKTNFSIIFTLVTFQIVLLSRIKRRRKAE